MSAKKVISLILILTLSLLFVVGCNSNSTELQPNQTTNSDETTLVNEDDQQDVDKTKVVFSTGMPDQAWKNALEQFIKTANEKLTDVEIVAEYYPSEEEMWKVLPAQIVSGAAPDIVGLNNEGVLELIVNGTFTPLDDLVKRLQLLHSALSTYHNSTSFIYLEKRVIRLNSCRTLSELLDEYGI